MKNVLLSLLALSLSTGAFAQGAFLPLDAQTYEMIDRYEIRRGKVSPTFHSGFKPYRRQDVAAFADTLFSESGYKSQQDKFNLSYLQADSWEWVSETTGDSQRPFLKKFYRKQADFYHVQTEDFDLHVNPVLYLGMGESNDLTSRAFINTRGVRLRGMIDEKIGFYSYLGENQVRLPDYVQRYEDSTGVVPGQWFWKPFSGDAYDYFTARGYVTFNASEHVAVQLGHDRNRVGNGYRSLILSDFGPAYFFLKLQTKVWRLQYTNLFTKMEADVLLAGNGQPSGNVDFPDKYMAFHHLSLNITDNLNIGVFEAVMLGAVDNTTEPDFEINYLNPIIFYRAIEQKGGSLGNALLGMDMKWIVTSGLEVYGQLVFDEFLLENLTGNDGWWGNKYALQGGLKYVDVLGIDNLDLQVEYNTARPYMYTHQTIYTNYQHYNQPLAHPLGANFKETVGILRYQPIPRLRFTGKLVMATSGGDSDGNNWGSNILLDYNTRVSDFGNSTGQGTAQDLLFGDFKASYMLKHNLWLDLNLSYRDFDSEVDAVDLQTTFVQGALRWNIGAQEFIF